MSNRFDAASDRIHRDDTFPDLAAGFTLLGWVRAVVDTNTNATIARLSASSGGTTVATLATGSDGLSGPGYFTAGGSVTATTNLAVNAWRKCAWGCSGTTGHVYVATVGGATEHVSGTVSVAAVPTQLCLAGRSSGDSSEEFSGDLAYFRLHSALLTQGQIEAEWASATPVITGSLWEDWPLLVHTNLNGTANARHLTAGSTATTTADDPPISQFKGGLFVPFFV